jgi:hypothetical protein
MESLRRQRFYSILAAVALALTAAPAVADGTLRNAEGPVRYAAGRALAYEGSAQIQQTADGEVSPPSKFKASEIVVAGSKESDDVVVIRSLEPQDVDEEEDAGPVGAFNVFTRGSKGLEPVEPSMELEDAQHLLGVYLPIRLQLSTASEKGVKREVKILNQTPVEAAVDIKIEKRDGGIAYGLTLAGDSSPAFDFRGNKAKLRKWNETCVVDKDGVVQSSTFAYSFDVDFQGTAITLAVSNQLKLQSVVDYAAKGSEKLSKAIGAYRAIVADFRARKGTKAVAPSVKTLDGLVKGTPFNALAIAASSQMTGYETTFESDDAGRLLAKLIGGKAPNFVLDDLDGKKIDFQKTSLGEVTYLVFWGVG